MTTGGNCFCTLVVVFFFQQHPPRRMSPCVRRDDVKFEGLTPNAHRSRHLRRALSQLPLGHSRAIQHRNEYPRFVQFVETLPMTATGKVLRRELRALG